MTLKCETAESEDFGGEVHYPHWRNHPHVGAHPRIEVSWYRNRPAHEAHPRFEVSWYRIDLFITSPMLRRGQPNSGESCIHQKADWLLASLPSFRSIHHLQYANFVQQPTKGCFTNLWWWCCGAWSASERLQLCTWAPPTYFRFTAQEFGMVGSLPQKPQNCQNWIVGACLGQYGMYNHHKTMTMLQTTVVNPSTAQ